MAVTARFLVLRAVSVAAALAASLALADPASAAVYYVGTGATCGDAPNDRPSLGAALLSAALNAGADEIRLTRTLTYTNQALDLVDWHATSAGALTVAGGYDHCDDATPSGRIGLVGRLGDSLVVVRTSAQPTSVVTLRALELSGSEFRGVAVASGGQLALQDVWIHANGGGGLVTAGGSLTVDATSSITDHDDNYPNGGGISCSGSGAYLALHGDLLRNEATQGGGNLHVGPGCLAELYGGALIEGHGEFPGATVASFGGGVYVDNGVLVAHGGASRVEIRGHHVSTVGLGAGLFVTGANAAVSLINTLIRDNSARIAGSGIHAESDALVVMDRAAACPFIISCSQIESNENNGGNDGVAVNVEGAEVRLTRTVVNQNGELSVLASSTQNLFHVANAGRLELDGVSIGNNFAVRLFHVESGGEVVGQYVTAARNSYEIGGVVSDPWAAVAEGGDVSFFSSIFDDTKGFSASAGGTTTADCLLVDSVTGLSGGTLVTIGVPQFINAAGGDLRQQPGSPGVDYCDEAVVPWPGSLDIERQARGVDVAANPNGSPGLGGGRFDVGFDEAHTGLVLVVDGFESGSAAAWSVKFP